MTLAALPSRLARSRWAGVVVAALLCGLYASGGPAWPTWILGFAALVPWLRTLDAETRLGRTLFSAWAMSVAYTAAVFFWFGSALGAYTQIGAAAGLALLLLAAPLFQPQILVFAVVRHLARRRHGVVLAAFAGAAAWVAAEWALPHVLGDTLGHGLYPAPLLRQAAELGGAAGLTVVLLLANEAVAAALARRHGGPRVIAVPLALATVGPLLLAGYGLIAQQPEPPSTTRPLRVGLVQSNITDYERLRRDKGAGAVVREVLDTHFAMSYDAVERQQVDAVLWSETVYPTSFGQPKSQAGAELDAEIQAIVDAAGVPFVFGTYDRDAEGEYNAAAFLQPRTGLLGMYRKTRLFPFTEYLPAWMGTLSVRGWLPGAGAWRPGSGARVFPLRLATDRGEGREVPVLPLICLDDTDAGLAIAGARLGAQVILTMSNDSWFTDYTQGAALHQAVAAFRSIETRLPQFRVTTNGFSAVIDARGNVIATTRMGERTLVIGDLPVRDPAPTLMVRWGDWVGRAAAGLLLGLAALTVLRRREPAPSDASTPTLPLQVVVLPATTRAVSGLLRLISRAGALAIGAAWLWSDGTLTANSLALLRMFTALCLIPEAAAWLLLQASKASLSLQDGQLLLSRGTRRLALPLHDIAAVEPWRCPLPGSGASLRLHAGGRWGPGLLMPNPWALAAALDLPVTPWPRRLAAWASSRSAHAQGHLGHPAVRFLLLPLLLAIPAFHLHQNIAYGSPLGEFYSFGLRAYLSAFSLWWAAWMAGVAACAAVLRVLIEVVSLAAALVRPPSTATARRGMERLGAGLLYAGLPAWLLVRLLA